MDLIDDIKPSCDRIMIEPRDGGRYAKRQTFFRRPMGIYSGAEAGHRYFGPRLHGFEQGNDHLPIDLGTVVTAVL